MDQYTKYIEKLQFPAGHLQRRDVIVTIAAATATVAVAGTLYSLIHRVRIKKRQHLPFFSRSYANLYLTILFLRHRLWIILAAKQFRIPCHSWDQASITAKILRRLWKNGQKNWVQFSVLTFLARYYRN